MAFFGKAFAVIKSDPFHLAVPVVIGAPFKGFVIPVGLPDIHLPITIRILCRTEQLSFPKMVNAVK